MKPEEAQLIEACLRKDERAYRRLYDLYASKMYGICLRYTSTNSAAEDVMHDGFIKVFENLHKLRDVSSLEAWMRKVMVYTAINSHRQELPLAASQNGKASIEDESLDSDNIIDRLDAEIIVKAIQELPASFRAVLNLCEIEGYSFNEAAKIMGIKDSSVRSTLVRAKKMLAQKLKNDFD